MEAYVKKSRFCSDWIKIQESKRFQPIRSKATIIQPMRSKGSMLHR